MPSIVQNIIVRAQFDPALSYDGTASSARVEAYNNEEGRQTRTNS